MKILNIDNNQKMSFGGKLVKTEPLVKYVKTLSEPEFDLFAKNVRAIEKFDDGKVFSVKTKECASNYGANESRLIGKLFCNGKRIKSQVLKDDYNKETEILHESSIYGEIKYLINDIFDMYNLSRTQDENAKKALDAKKTAFLESLSTK